MVLAWMQPGWGAEREPNGSFSQGPEGLEEMGSWGGRLRWVRFFLGLWDCPQRKSESRQGAPEHLLEEAAWMLSWGES